MGFLPWTRYGNLIAFVSRLVNPGARLDSAPEPLPVLPGSQRVTRSFGGGRRVTYEQDIRRVFVAGVVSSILAILLALADVVPDFAGWALLIAPVAVSSLVARRHDSSLSEWVTLTIAAYLGAGGPWVILLFVALVAEGT